MTAAGKRGNEAPILLASPGSAYIRQKDAIDAAIRGVLERGLYLMGPETAEFELEFGRYLGVEHVITTGSGTDALVLALRTLGVGPGDAVVTVSHTAVATVTAIDLVGALPVLVDVDPDTYCMDPSSLEAVLRGASDLRIRAVLPVHLYGHPAAMRQILEIADRHGVPVIEDCAQAHGAILDSRKVGTSGTFGAFSFYPTKNLGALGDGGALVTNDARLAERARCFKEYGWKERYVSHLAGMVTRLDELHAAVLRVKLPHLNASNAQRRNIATTYQSILSPFRLTLPQALSNAEHVFHQYVIQSENRNALRDYLTVRGISTNVHYPVPVHLQPGYCNRVRVASSGLPQTESLCTRILSLPIHPYLKDEDVSYIGSVIADWCRKEHP